MDLPPFRSRLEEHGTQIIGMGPSADQSHLVESRDDTREHGRIDVLEPDQVGHAHGAVGADRPEHRRLTRRESLVRRRGVEPPGEPAHRRPEPYRLLDPDLFHCPFMPEMPGPVAYRSGATGSASCSCLPASKRYPRSVIGARLQASPRTEDSGRSRYLVFAIVSTAMLMSSVDQTIVATALRTLQRDLHATVNWSTWTITAYALGQIIASPLAGAVSDQIGRKRTFLGAIVVFGLSSLACAFVDSIYVLVALRAVQALGGGAFIPSATGIVSDHFGRGRDRAIGMFASIIPIGGLLGPVLGGILVTYLSWRAIFLVNVPVSILVLLLAAAFIRDVRKPAVRRIDVLGIGLLAAGLLGLMLAISHMGERAATPGDVGFAAPGVVGLGMIAAFLVHSARERHPFLPLRLLVGRGFALLNLLNFLSGVSVLGFSALVPLYAQDRYGMSPLASGTLLTARAVGTMLVAGLATLALRRTGVRLPMITGSLVSGIGLVLLSLRPIGMSPYAWLSVAAAVTGLGLGISLPASNNAVLQLAPENTAAVAGLRGMFRQIGGITGVSIVGATIARSADPGMTQANIFICFAAILFCVAPAVLRVPEHRGQW